MFEHPVDRTDIRILATLAERGRIQNQQLADIVGLSPGACSVRLRRLENIKLISGYRAEVEMRRIADIVSIYAIIKLTHQTGAKQGRFLKRLETIEEVVDCFEVAGEADYLIRFDCKTIEQYHEQISNLLDDEQLGVSSIISHVVLQHVRALKRSNLNYLIDSPQNPTRCVEVNLT